MDTINVSERNDLSPQQNPIRKDARITPCARARTSWAAVKQSRTAADSLPTTSTRSGKQPADGPRASGLPALE